VYLVLASTSKVRRPASGMTPSQFDLSASKDQGVPGPRCPVCDSWQWKMLAKFPGFGRSKCGLVARVGDVDEAYGHTYFTGVDGATGHRDFESNWSAIYDGIRFQKELDDLGGPSGRARLLDVGSATGSFLRMASERGWTTTGVEISDYAREVAMRNGQMTVATLDDARSRGPYDCVTLHHVLEHLEDPLETLVDVRALLSSDGRMLIEVPNWMSSVRYADGRDWVDLRPEQHRWMFSARTLGHLCQRAGLKSRSIRTLGEPYPTFDSLLASLGFHPAFRRIMSTALRGGTKSTPDRDSEDSVPRLEFGTPGPRRSIVKVARLTDQMLARVRMGSRLVMIVSSD
jgi:SAM-dependent methyltransferase